MLEMSMSKVKDREIICKVTKKIFFFHFISFAKMSPGVRTFILKIKETPKLYLLKCKMFYHELKSMITSAGKVKNVLLTRSASL